MEKELAPQDLAAALAGVTRVFGPVVLLAPPEPLDVPQDAPQTGSVAA